jgi:hypothetical protein
MSDRHDVEWLADHLDWDGSRRDLWDRPGWDQERAARRRARRLGLRVYSRYVDNEATRLAGWLKEYRLIDLANGIVVLGPVTIDKMLHYLLERIPPTNRRQ